MLGIGLILIIQAIRRMFLILIPGKRARQQVAGAAFTKLITVITKIATKIKRLRDGALIFYIRSSRKGGL